MPKKKTFKICIVGNSFAKGGSEKAHANLSNFFHQKGIEVHNIIFEDKISYNYSGTLFNLGKIKNNTILSKINRYKILYNYIKNHQIDYVIDLRFRGTFYGEYILSKFIFGQTKYIPSIRGFRLYGYFTNNHLVAKRIYSNAYKIVTVSKEMEQEIRVKYNYQNLKTIYNMVETDKIIQLSKEKTSESLNFDYIIALGRMAVYNIKQQDLIIKAYAQSILPENGFKLLLLGDGEKRKEFEQLTTDLNLSDKVIFTGFKDNPYPYLKNAKFMVLASKTEGFPNVILESFTCQTPVVSFDCKSGPKEVIKHRENGLLVNNQNISELTKAMNLMLENEDLYNKCKLNSLCTALDFSPEKIGQQWLEMLLIEPKNEPIL